MLRNSIRLYCWYLKWSFYKRISSVLYYFRLAHALASSFNFQGRVKKTFYVLTDDKVGSGPRLRPQALIKDPSKDVEPTNSMEVEVLAAATVQAPAPSGSAKQCWSLIFQSRLDFTFTKVTQKETNNKERKETVVRKDRLRRSLLEWCDLSF
jgi:hypothetical protein